MEYIHDLAFYGCSSLEMVCLPKNVKRIGKGVFEDMDSLRYIVCRSNFPPEVQDRIPDYPQSMLDLGITPITDDVKLIVPTESIEAYSSHDFWGKFDIEGFSDDPVV